jgi:N-acetyl-gamma-glutamyl-phosphate/LysW-gamma-L-alpha-aminoadipyl-6-phosphate reductase
MKEASVIGASGYAGGELLRLLLQHPQLRLRAAYSKSHAGKYIHSVHPNLRGLLDRTFSDEEPVNLASSSDITFFALPHGQSSQLMREVVKTGTRVVDLGADFRLKDQTQYQSWYHFQHPAPELLTEFVYGLPEIHRGQLKGAMLVSSPGCIATSALLSLAPLAREGLLDGKVIVDAKVGSSGSGGRPSAATHYSERYGVIRAYKPSGHRHTAELLQELSAICGKSVSVGMSAHSVNIVRGLLTTSYIFSEAKLTVKDLWRVFRSFYEGSRFVRLVRDLSGVNRLPDPKFSFGSNFADLGFDVDASGERYIVIGALDNLVKGAAGNAIQCANLMLGFDESDGLLSPPIHPA